MPSSGLSSIPCPQRLLHTFLVVRCNDLGNANAVLNHNLPCLETSLDGPLGLKNFVELLQGSALGLWEREEDCDKDNDVNSNENDIKLPAQVSNSGRAGVKVDKRGNANE
jgi:hypothetical protein